MRSNLGFILDRLPLNIAESGTDILLHWSTVTGGTFDVTTQTTEGGVKSAHSTTVRALAVHFIQDAASWRIQGYNEVQVGDKIVDFGPDVALEGKAELRFEIDGELWTQRPLGGNPAKSFDATIQNQPLCRTVILMRAR